MLVVGDVVQRVSTGKHYSIKWVGEHCGFTVATIDPWNSIDVEPNQDGYYYPIDDYYKDSNFKLLPPKPNYCHLYTKPELQCTEQCNHCNEFDKTV
jgi:hypothetical protein